MKHGLRWYWHRLRAMGGAELRERLAQRWRQAADGRRVPDFSAVPVGEPASLSWPTLPVHETAPEVVREALAQEAEAIRAGRWRLFGHLSITVHDPPRWFMDYAAGREVPTARPGFRLNHRELPRGTDIKPIWEISRWSELVRLAQAGWVLGEAEPAATCVRWLADWVRRNPPYLGWNWTSALEAGVRLLNFASIDALLEAAGTERSEIETLRQRILPAHVWYVWRHRSFGSSANNHLLGELAGLLVAETRWPALERWGGPVESLHRQWEAEVLRQFAPDGGNREQALHYQLFSWELCWAAWRALTAAGRPVSSQVEERLRRAADFFVTVQAPSDPWDYGDTDSATVTPWALDPTCSEREWWAWFSASASSPGLQWWLGDPPAPVEPPACVRTADDWLVYPESGQAICWSGDWLGRWDLSPLGLEPMAAHGHLDALHLSLWLRGVALVIDPGTGAYYGDTRLRSWLASWGAHNGPHVPGPAFNFPRRLGPFLWEQAHAVPTWRVSPEGGIDAGLQLPHGTVRRRVTRLSGGGRDGWQVDDVIEPGQGGCADLIRVCWQFAPGTRLEPEPNNPHRYLGERRGVPFTVGIDAAWRQVRFIPETTGTVAFPVEGDLLGLCSPEFRRVQSGPVLILTAKGTNPARYRTTFLAGHAPHMETPGPR
ncbi:MAG: heparinase II/III family protein [Verrucomicrobiae bacterium]|nr:heparinase II/III family protein [Verrucomicrobiae bacterium]